jgi:magnesium-transporting ATPase (P-type)
LQDAQHTLYAGTHVIELQPLAKSQRVLGLCIRTRFLSSHGRLIRSSLFPTGPFFDFNAQALSFFGYMFLFSLIGAGISIATGYYFNFTFQVIVIRTLDLFTDALPPALPAVLGMGIVVAMNHLSSHYKINCINAGRINLAGLIDTFVFDKTGTLTEQKLSLYGCIQVENSQCQLNSSKLSIQQKFYTNVLCRPSKYTTTHSSARKRERQKIKRKFAILKKQSLTGSTESRHFYSVSKQLHHFVKPKSASFGFLQIQPTLLKRHFVEAMATCHSLSLIDNTVRGDPLDSTLLHFTGWKIHNIQDDITQVEQFMLVLRKTIGKDKRLLKHFKPFLKFSSQEIVTRQIFDLYKTNHTLPTIIKPPQEPISLLQTIRHTRFSHILTTLSEIQADNSASYASLMAINIKPYLIYLTKLSNTINQKKFPKNQLNELAILRRYIYIDLFIYFSLY